MVNWLMARTGISSGANKIVDGLDQRFWWCKPFDGTEEAWTGISGSASHTLDREN
jgi:hypothetical protein